MLQVGVHTETGIKSDFLSWQNQDRHLVLPLGTGRLLVAVFDGHGPEGHTVAERVRTWFGVTAPRLIPQAPALLTKAGAAASLRRLFSQAHRTLEQNAAEIAELSGTTSTVALLDAHTRTMTVAYTGDSSLGVFRDGKVTHVTADHLINDEVEQRVKECGGEVRTQAEVKRIFKPGSNIPGLMMSRSLGDLCAHRLGASSTPEVIDLPLMADNFIVVASDGIWEKMPAATVADTLPRLLSEKKGCVAGAARAIVMDAKARWVSSAYTDDITAVVVHIDEDVDTSEAFSQEVRTDTSPSRKLVLIRERKTTSPKTIYGGGRGTADDDLSKRAA